MSVAGLSFCLSVSGDRGDVSISLLTVSPRRSLSFTLSVCISFVSLFVSVASLHVSHPISQFLSVSVCRFGYCFYNSMFYPDTNGTIQLGIQVSLFLSFCLSLCVGLVTVFITVCFARIQTA